MLFNINSEIQDLRNWDGNVLFWAIRNIVRLVKLYT